MTTPPCPKCGAPMHEGYLLDHTHGGYIQSTWVAGPPDRSVWVGLKLRGHARHPVVTFRCRDCGFLESYAREEAPPDAGPAGGG